MFDARRGQGFTTGKVLTGVGSGDLDARRLGGPGIVHVQRVKRWHIAVEDLDRHDIAG